jgi:hypothetical protein
MMNAAMIRLDDILKMRALEKAKRRKARSKNYSFTMYR